MKASFCLVLFNIVATAYAQMETSNWAFGEGLGLNFSNSSPVASSDYAIKSVNGSAVVSDRNTGKLLFYTDGRTFWNSMHQTMPGQFNRSATRCYSLVTQPAIILPSNVNPDLYHVFCIRANPEDTIYQHSTPCSYFPNRSELPNNESGFSLYYVEIDMSLNKGMGGIVESRSNILLENNVVQKLTAIPHANGNDYWVITHQWQSNRFLVYHFSDGAIRNTLAWDIGSIHGAYGGIFFQDEMQGELKPSPDGKRLASAVFSEERPFDLFNFNDSTGEIYEYVNLGNVSGQYGTSFSPDNSKLYVSSDSRTVSSELIDIILQYDLSVKSAMAIKSSVTSIVVENPYTNLPATGILDGWSTAPKGMALANDGRLYISGNEPRDETEVNNILVAIDQPNRYGYDCKINYEVFSFGKGKTGVGLPNFMQSYFNGLESASVCSDASSVNLYPNPVLHRLKLGIKEGCRELKSVQVIDEPGRSIYYTTGPVREIDFNNFASGIYLIIFSTSYNSTFAKKVVKH